MHAQLQKNVIAVYCFVRSHTVCIDNQMKITFDHIKTLQSQVSSHSLLCLICYNNEQLISQTLIQWLILFSSENTHGRFYKFAA